MGSKYQGQQGQQTAANTVGYGAAVAGLVSYGVARLMRQYVEQVELLFVVTILLAGVGKGAGLLAKKWFMRDHRLDNYEAFRLDVFSLWTVLMYFCSIQYAIEIVFGLAMESDIQLPFLLLNLAVLLYITLSLLPFVQDQILRSNLGGGVQRLATKLKSVAETRSV